MTANDYLNIIELLEDSTEPHLADAFYLVPDEHQEAISKAVQEMRGKGFQRAVIRFNVIKDVSASLEGNQMPNAAKFLPTC